MTGDTILGSRRLYEGWLNLVLVEFSLNGKVEQRPLIEHPSGSAVLPYDPDRRVALVVRQTRLAVLHENASALTEAIAGVAEHDDFAATAKREAFEEGGLRLGALEKVGAIWTDANTSTERIHLFLAEYRESDRVTAGGGLDEENEQLRVLERPLASLWRDVTSAELADAKTLLLLQALRLRRADLFEE